MITFDVGQTLVELDLDFLCLRLGGRGIRTSPGALAAASPAAWARYDALVEAGEGHPWHELVDTLLAGAGVEHRGAVVDWLWSEQPHRNLWRKPITSMVSLARELSGRGIPLAIVSNSEGRLAELLAEIAIADPFAVVVDSGRFGIAKPDRRIFDHALAQLGATGSRVLHIGDSWAADVQGALGAGWDAVWYGRKAEPVGDPRVLVARDPDEARDAIERWLRS